MNVKNAFVALPFVQQYIIAFYDKKRKRIVKYGSSRPCGINYFKASKHAEQLAIEYCEKNKHRKYEIYIWKYNKNSSIKQANCCHSCTILANKYNYNIFTFDENMNKISAIREKPQVSLCYKIKHNCFH